MVGHAAAGWTETLQDTDYTTYMTATGGVVSYHTRANGELVDCRIISGGLLRNTDPTPDTYFAYTVTPAVGNSVRITAWSEALAEIYTAGDYYTSATEYARYEMIRSGTKFYFYKNGVLLSTSSDRATIPYYYGIKDGAGLFFDDLVYGAEQEHNVVSCPPQGWFVAKDIFQSEFSGLYSAVNTQESPSEMTVQYAVDGGSGTITVTDVTTSAVVNTTIITKYAGIITYNLTTMLFNSGAPYGQYRVQIAGSTASDTFMYLGIATSGTSVEWDDTEYVDGDTGTLSYSISETHWMTDDYTYEP
jgi:hypothetical protein